MVAAIDARRDAGASFDRAELTRRVDELDDGPLASQARHEALAELYANFTPPNFRLVPFPDDSLVETAGHRIRIRAMIVDDRIGQVVAEIDRDLHLDAEAVNHELLRIQRAYRGSALSLVLLQQAFPLYRQLGLRLILVHAALETGRWQWARLGFEAVPADRSLVMSWATVALGGLGVPLIDPTAPIRRLAQLGTGEPPEEVSLEQVHAAVAADLTRRQEDPALAGAVTPMVAAWDERSLDETGGRMRMLEPARLAMIAAANRITPGEAIPIGKAIMLTGPDWNGYFDLADQAAQDAFDREFGRRFSGR
jgi:hypothetical protein